LKECVYPTFKKREKSWNLGCQESRTKKLCEYLLLKKGCPTFEKLVSGAEDEEKRNIFYFYLKKCACPTFRNVDFAAKPEKNLWKIAGDRSRGKNN
jgi:hypothetical protein